MVNRNHFTAKFSTKSDQELQTILESQQHVDEAKLAAKWILDERGERANVQVSSQTIKDHKPWIFSLKQDSEQRKHYWWQMVIFGIACIIGAFYINFQNLLTSKSSLTELRGTIHDSNVVVDNVSSRNRMGYEAKSRRATLSFSLNEHQKSFEIMENIGQDYSHDEYNRMSNLLNKSETVVVWINKSELGNVQPKVFQIDVNNRTILNFSAVKYEHTGVFIFMLLLGIGITGFAFYSRYPDRTRKVLGFN